MVSIQEIPGAMGLGKDQLMELYYKMFLARTVGQRERMLNRMGKGPFAVTGEGHEATQVGTAYALTPGKDWVFPYYRDIGVALTIGMTARDLLLAHLSRASAIESGGRNMPSHFSHPQLHIVSGSAPVGTQVVHAVGVALASKLRGLDEVAMTYVGDGGTSVGDMHEAMNFAGVHKCPVIFVCENNQYAISVPWKRQSAVENVSIRAQGYGFPGVTVDGNDVLAVYTAAKEAVDRARRGEGATFIEAKTYRLVPHTSDDDDRRYRSREEVAQWTAKDPLTRHQAWLEEHGVADKQEIEAVQTKALQEVDEATKQAEDAPLPDPETALLHVYVDERNASVEIELSALSKTTARTLMAITKEAVDTAGLSDEHLLDIYYKMRLGRAMGERQRLLQRMGKGSITYSCEGHEGVQVGVAAAMTPGKDWLFPYYRDTAFALALGMTPRDVLMSFFARAHDINSGGRNMPSHFSSVPLRIVSEGAPVATQAPHAVGAALASKLRGLGEVAVTTFGDGGTSPGDMHESMNFAGVHKLPVIFVCEFNNFAISVPSRKQMAVENVAIRAQGYGFPGIAVDGNDVLAVYRAAKEAVDRARAGEGATFIEAKTYRLVPHSSDDNDTRYRTKTEVEGWAKRDPIPRFAVTLQKLGVLTGEKDEQIGARIKQEVDEATEWAEQQPEPDPATALRHVFVEE